MLDVDKEVWLQVACAVLRSGQSPLNAKEAADATLSAFNLRFPKETNEGQAKKGAD